MNVKTLDREDVIAPQKDIISEDSDMADAATG